MNSTYQKPMQPKNCLHLPKQTILQLLAVCWQGDRSIDAVLHPSQANWEELRKYYTTERQDLVRSIFAKCGLDSVPLALITVETRKSIQSPRYFLFITCVMNKLRKRWRFCKDEQLFLASCLGRLLSNLKREVQPSQEELVQLRLDLTTAVSYLENKLYGIRELSLVKNVEYYAPPAGKSLSSISEALHGVE